MSKRKQYVLYDNAKSDYKNIVNGMPQGSILGPKLFIIYINDICNVSKLLKFILFADDTNILYQHDDYNVLCKIINDELLNLSKWFSVRKLSLNVNKTNLCVLEINW